MNKIITVADSKSGKSRNIPMNKICFKTLHLSVRSKVTPLVFPSTKKSKMSGWRLTNIQSSFETARDMAGLSDFTFHDLRHTFASHMVMKGVDIVTVSKLLGHANLVMTMRDAHLAPNHLKQAIESIEL